MDTETYLKKKKIKKEYGKNRYLNMSEKKRLKKYQRNYREARKSQYNNE